MDDAGVSGPDPLGSGLQRPPRTLGGAFDRVVTGARHVERRGQRRGGEQASEQEKGQKRGFRPTPSAGVSGGGGAAVP